MRGGQRGVGLPHFSPAVWLCVSSSRGCCSGVLRVSVGSRGSCLAATQHIALFRVVDSRATCMVTRPPVPPQYTRRCLEVQEAIWAETFKYMADNKVMFEGILLKPAMVTPGACCCSCDQSMCRKGCMSACAGTYFMHYVLANVPLHPGLHCQAHNA